MEWFKEEQGVSGKTYEFEVASGQPAGTTVWTRTHQFGFTPDITGEYSVEGTDAEYFEPRIIDKESPSLHTFVEPSASPDTFFYTLTNVTTRPLSAGVYRYHPQATWALLTVCDGENDLEGTLRTVVVTVKAPSKVSAEALFDAADLSPGVGTASVAKPYVAPGFAGSIGRISWNGGSLTVGLNPTSAFSGKFLDFIRQDGTVSLSLAAADATVDATNKTLSWSVSSQPWKVGDKMMVRIHDGTVTPGG